MKKLRVGILFGGRSGEHEVSLLSAASVLKAINRAKYDIVPLGISKTGEWLTGAPAEAMLGTSSAAPGSKATKQAAANSSKKATKVKPSAAEQPGSPQIILRDLDVVFPVLHGTFGEDGTMQGLFELADVAYVGSGVLGSSAGMDKDAMKRLFRAAGLPIPKHQTLLRSTYKASPRKAVKQLEAALKYPFFVKPANGGSSVGISKVHNREELPLALDLAAKYDRKLVIEQAVGGRPGRGGEGKAREVEVAVLGNEQPEASVVGEVVPVKEFYDYEAKYLMEGSELILPAKLTPEQEKSIRAMAVEAFAACDCAGLARVDFLIESGERGRIYLNEINTMPGFTAISMYPKLWGASGVAYSDLIDRLIQLALERHAERGVTSYSL